MKLTVNGQSYDVDVEENMPLLWVLRDELGILGPKFGCGLSQCGACTVHIDGEATKTCQLAVSDVWGEIVTIEGLGTPEAPHPVQQAWIDHQVPQCGYCQNGFMMNAASLLSQTPDPTDEDINDALSQNICRCGTYPRMREAVKTAAKRMKENA